jgi:glutathione S-transferase
MGARTWASGESFTIADCAAAPALFYAGMVQPFPPGNRILADYFERLMARPSVRRAIAEARPYFQYFPLHHAIPPRYLSDGDDSA